MTFALSSVYGLYIDKHTEHSANLSIPVQPLDQISGRWIQVCKRKIMIFITCSKLEDISGFERRFHTKLFSGKFYILAFAFSLLDGLKT